MLRALGEFEIGGITTLLGFHRALLEHPCFVEGATCHGVVESEELAERAEQLSHRADTVPAGSDGAASGARLTRRAGRPPLRGRGARAGAAVRRARPAAPRARRRPAARRRQGRRGDARCRARCSRSRSPRATRSSAGQVICVVEAMKMENEIAAHRAGVVTELAVEPGQAVSSGQVICVVESRRRARVRAPVDLYEYQGKELFRALRDPGVRGPAGDDAGEARAAAAELGGQVVVKAQVLTGGRGKAGGVKLADGPDDAEQQGRRDPRARHQRPRRAQALDRARVGDREGVLPLGHLRPRRSSSRSSCSRPKAASRSRRSPRRIRTRSRACTSTRSRASSPTRRGA